MKHHLMVYYLCLALPGFWGCKQNSLPGGELLSLEWKVISNDFDPQPAVKAQFTLTNNSNLELTGRNWALFYNQSPRQILRSSNFTKITHLSGDWYKLEPLEGFLLKPGEKTDISYEASVWWIKVSDAPLGPYFVFYDKKGKERKVTPAVNYTISPFTAPEQVSRHRVDLEPLPDPSLRYKRNLELTDLSEEHLPLVIPTPLKAEISQEWIFFDTPPALLYEKGLETEASFAAGVMERIAGSAVSFREAGEPAPNSIYLGLTPSGASGFSREAYRLDIRKDKSVIISGSDPAGVFYGIQSLIALLSPEAIAGTNASPVALPVVTLVDAPRFPYRGLHIDVARNFQTRETLLKMIDLMAFYKLNYLMLYLSEDEGWRIAIESLPELTEVGSRRGHTSKEGINWLHPSYGSGPFPGQEGSFGSGFYSRETFMEILTYAQQRHISIIPTINLPGHSRAAIRAMEARYQRFMKEGNEEKAQEFRLIDPDDQSVYSSAQSYNDNVVCVARESVYRFYETVIDEIISMYRDAGVPLEYFHTGGDEVPEGAWSQSPLCRALMDSVPELADPRNLQGYFLGKVVDILEKKNLKTGGWEEVALMRTADGQMVPNPAFTGRQVVPWAWNNMGVWANLAYRLTNAGYPVVMCDVSNFYFDFAYDKDPEEPGLYWGGFCDVRNAWQFAPYHSFYTNLKTAMGRNIDPEVEFRGLERLNPEARKNILGLQAQLWSETIRGPAMLEYLALPKLIGFAETAWGKARPWESEANPAKRKQLMDEGWNQFANVLGKRELPRLSRLSGGFNYRVPPPGAVIEEEYLKANVEYPGLTIRYTTDGSEPTAQSSLYSEPVQVSGEVLLKAFDAAGKSSRVVRVP